MTQKISRYLDVAVPLPVRKPLTYRLPAGLPGCAEPGARAQVPVARRLVTGVIVGNRSEPPVDEARVRDVAGLPDAAPAVPADLLSLTLWAARYYVAPPGVTLAAALPPGGGRVGAKYGRLISLEDHPLEEALAACARAPRQKAVLQLLAARRPDPVPMEEINDRLGPSGAPVGELIRKRLVRSSRVEILRAPPLPAEAPAAGGTGSARFDLTPDQNAALTPVTRALEAGSFGVFLLMGVTGSGKTEVYLRAIERCLASGRDALYLVPEITLTPLLARNLRARLGADLAILHSSLSPGERFDEWGRARRGRARIVLGARSAILAPLGRIGLIVVDEEQDASYKQEEDPRYNARDLAMVRGRASHAVVLLGSATPSVESYHAALSKRYELLRLPARILERPMARVRVVDMREEFSRTGRDDLVSAPLRDAVADRLARGEQAIILLNRRGYAPYMLCRSCGGSETCRRCSVALTYHRTDDRMRCHYCGYQRGRPAACSTCSSSKIVLTGAGTEKLEEQMRATFPGARLARLDRDTARGRRAPAEILGAFERGEFNLLVGTQMVAKGHDFPGVTIVGVIGADNILAFPDFRAAERTFQLLTQVAGRSGRGTEPGEVIVQAWHCEHYAIEAASRQDYQAFFEKESRYRRIMRYPPFAVMANVLVRAGSPESGVRRARLVGDAVREAARAVAGEGAVQILGPSVAPIARLKGRYRYQVLVKGPSRRKLSDALNEAAGVLAAKGLSSSKDLVIDMDPVSLL